MIRHDSQRGWFAYELHQQMSKNKKIFLLTGDLGYGMFNAIRDDFPDRFVNVGAAEQSLVGLGVGLAMSGKIPFCYSITPFLLYRPFETIRNYINGENIPVKLIGGGRDRDYEIDGFSHNAEDDRRVIELFTHIISFWPETKEEVPDLVKSAIKYKDPFYINLRR